MVGGPAAAAAATAAVKGSPHGRDRRLLERLVPRHKLTLGLAAGTLRRAVVLGLLGEEAALPAAVLAPLGVAGSLLGTRALGLAERGRIALGRVRVAQDQIRMVHGQREPARVVGQRKKRLAVAERSVRAVVKEQCLVASHLFMKKLTLGYLRQTDQQACGHECGGCANL